MVEPPLWKIWKSVESVGMIIPNLWNNRKCSKPSTSYGFKLFKTSCWPIEIATLGYPMWFGQIQRSFGVFIRSFRKSEWWIDHDSPHVRCQYRIPIIAVAKITILVAWYPLPLASEECLYLEFGISPLLLAEILKKTGSNSSTNNMYQHVMAYCHYYLYT